MICKESFCVGDGAMMMKGENILHLNHYIAAPPHRLSFGPTESRVFFFYLNISSQIFYFIKNVSFFILLIYPYM